MKVLRYLGITLALASFAPASYAVEDKSGQLWENFYYKLLTVIRGGNGKEKEKDLSKGNSNPVSYICLNVPGIPLAKMDKDSKDDENYINSLLDETVQFDPIYTKGKRTFSSIYSDILQFHHTEDEKELSKADQALLKKAMAETDPENPKMQAYLKLQKEYNDILIEKEEALLEKKSARVNALNAELNVKRREWESKGFKNAIKIAYDTIRQKTAGSPKVWWTNLDDSFHNAMIGNDKQGSPIYGITTYPPYELWANDEGWLKFTYKASEKTSSMVNNETDRSFGAKVKVGLYKAEGSRSSERKAMNAVSNDSSLEISMEIKKVIISRRWFDWHVFVSDKWTWSKGIDSSGKNKVISNGKGGGELPLYTDTIIIVRNVKFKSKLLSTMKNEFMEEVKSSASASYGPISMEGSARDKEESSKAEDKEEAGTISIKDPQIIGFTCTVVPKCPAKPVK